ncbi:cation-translocating P-type ATPase [Lentisphaera profundi]|uniref:P-type Zn(2+) transporter n=1 Tax=Lentisphaera profundi TaxID=1658616 RepID=A0ABY7VP63_9BACT|nr:cation-translocating P-type ATPase [Lentisphaera profundi]WDE95946.1 cation-translocating P-type ATPase [Lentisphaera profundi]
MSTKENSSYRYLIWAGAGLLFIINAQVFRYFIDDQLFLTSLSGLIATIIMLIPLVATVFKDFRAGERKMHELAIIAVLASCVGSEDFTTPAAIAFFLLISLVIENKTASGVKASLEKLAKLVPGKAMRLDKDGKVTEVEPTDLTEGDIIRIPPGENILADGDIMKGKSSINEANISGESLPVDKQEGDAVFAGTVNLNGLLEIRVTRAGKDTTIGKVRDLIMNAEQTKLPFVRMIDEYVRFYVPIILTATALILYFNPHANDTLMRVTAALVIACPVALILATPTAIVASLSAAARSGILIKDINHIESMARADAFMFDKTGTLTSGTLAVELVAPLQDGDEISLIKAAAIAESASSHPVARAVRRFAEDAGFEGVHPDNLHEEPGRGVRADWDGHTILAGNFKWMEDNGINTEYFDAALDDIALSMSLLYISIDGIPAGWLGLSDSLRSDSADTLNDLKNRGIRYLGIVSGDRQSVVDMVGSKLALNGRNGGCSPEDKVKHLQALKEKGYHVVFVGDGVNDGPALATADIGIAMGAAGSDIAVESASIALMNDNLNRLPFLVQLSRSMRSVVLQNLVLGIFIILGGMILAAMGMLQPVIAAAFQVIGSLAVVMNSARLVRQGENLSGDSHE